MSLVFIPMETIFKVIVPFFNRPSSRYFKQAIVLFGAFACNLGCILTMIFFAAKACQADRYIGLYAAGIAHQVFWMWAMNISFHRHTLDSPALYPFDLP